MESGHDTGSDLKTHQVASPSENSHVTPAKKSRRPSHSSSSSSSGEAIRLGSTGTSTSNAGVHTPLGDEQAEEDIPVSSMPDSGQSSDGSAALIPPPLPTERPAGGSPSEASKRIPSYVFARTKSSGPMEWSVASNESLFSIHMGNMSFTRDQLSWMSKSGELGCINDPTISGPLLDVPSNQTPPRKSTEIAKKSGTLDDGYGVTEAAAAETMREVLREKESQRDENNAKESPRSRSMSQHSDTSVKSFAFPILTGDGGKSGSFRPNTKNKKQLSRPSTPKTTPQTPPETPKPQTPPETPKPQTPKPETPKETRSAGPRRWFSCFSCCPSCS
ncbi:hypothetical protein QQP08_010610 [Theobroma cacao]|uniref:Nipped-B-like protein n=1 Tax=Theobroma cacao TaxID=3641 RepID=A0AB32W405_THECC|nr:PREDICTED: nipped-B-like protein [Theobroma cacao]WRX18123.1 hypothetical protein QQP08_010610 [Theobroma cacao]